MEYYIYYKKYLEKELDDFLLNFWEYKKYIKSNNIIFSDNILLFLDNKIDLIRWQLNNFNKESWFKNETLFRLLLQEVSLLQIELDYRSASYQESLYSNTFNLDNFSKKDVNYNRYSSKYIKKLESYLLDLYWLNNFSCLVTSSWMSAYSVVEWYILRKSYNKWDNIFIPSYIYFESFEQLSNLEKAWLNIIYWKDNNYNEDWILNFIYTEKPRYVFLDAILNISDIKISNIEYILESLNNNYIWDLTIIIDITMSWIENNFGKYNNLDIVIYWSWSKYLFNGLDTSMMWFIFFRSDLYDKFERQRRNMWAILYDFQALQFPLLWKDFYKNRLDSITKDVKYFYNYLNNNKEIIRNYNIFYWWEKLLNKWKDYFWWSIVTINFKEYSLRNKFEYKKIIDSLIIEAKNQNVALIEWVSFWFSITRVSASDVMSKWEPPFLRVSIWPNYYNDIVSLSKIFEKVLSNYF